MSDFDLRKAIRVIASERDEWDLDTLTDLVIKATPRNQVAASYRLALRDFIRVEIGNPRHDDSRPGQGTYDDHMSLAGAASLPNHARSRAALARAGFRLRVHVGPGSWKSIEVCTAAELLYAAAECDRMAEFNARRADQYRSLVKLLEEHGATTVGDLSTEIVEKVLGDDDH